MTLFCLAENLSMRVGRDGVWIWAPSVSPRPIHLDARTLAEMGLRLAVALGEGSAPPALATSPRPSDQSRNA